MVADLCHVALSRRALSRRALSRCRAALCRFVALSIYLSFYHREELRKKKENE